MPRRHQPIRSILIANRGEIAMRVIRACKELGIRSVSIYSDPDRESMPARMADLAVSIGGSTPAESYLDQEKVIDAALNSGCDAVHPGYGFLSENPLFADRVEQSNLRFIGPSAHAIRMLGDKMAAKAIAHRIGVPTAGGSGDALASGEEAIVLADTIGYPVLIKAAAGGGGKGMRLVTKREDVASSVEAAQREAKSAFGDGRVFVEKYIEHPRHIEFQMLSDGHGNVIHLGERECSVQRRHQKVIEESPSVLLSPALRREMGEAACALIREAGYENASTVEFLVDNDNRFYFLEVNTRLQVEHPITEMVTGIDLVHQQIAIAQGNMLGITQNDVHQRGWAIECRILAEDPWNNFLPATGRIEALVLPTGEGIRNDTALFSGLDISPYYDSMLGKLIVWGETRDNAINRMRSALIEMFIGGVSTSIPFCRFVLDHPAFVSGKYSTQFVGDALNGHSLAIPEDIQSAAIAAAVVFTEHILKPIPSTPSRWVKSRRLS